MKYSILCLAFGVIAAVTFPAIADVNSRDGGPTRAEMLARTSEGAPDGMAFFRPVLSGVLYRGGFSGGDKNRVGLSSSQRQALCSEGFSVGFYADFGKNTKYGTTSCGNGSFDYESARSSRPSSVMKAIYEVVKEPNKGPVFVHCMWGVHSSGALSAMALVQFCGWSESKAKAYWDEARNGAPCSGGCDKWIDAKFDGFKIDPSLAITDAEKSAICPEY